MANAKNAAVADAKPVDIVTARGKPVIRDMTRRRIVQIAVEPERSIAAAATGLAASGDRLHQRPPTACYVSGSRVEPGFLAVMAFAALPGLM